jgi:hypothetical protein
MFRASIPHRSLSTRIARVPIWSVAATISVSSILILFVKFNRGLECLLN